MVPDNVLSLDVGRYYGGGLKYKQVWNKMKPVKDIARALTTVVEAGLDPNDVDLADYGLKSKTQGIHCCSFASCSCLVIFAAPCAGSLLILLDISARFGGDCTKSALENRFRRIRSDAKLINAAVDKGIDPIALNIGDTDGEVVVRSGKGNGQTAVSSTALAHFPFVCLSRIDVGSEIARCFGTDATASAIQNVTKRQIRPSVKLIQDYLAAGNDPKDLAIEQLWAPAASRNNGSFVFELCTSPSVCELRCVSEWPSLIVFRDCELLREELHERCTAEPLQAGYYS